MLGSKSLIGKKAMMLSGGAMLAGLGARAWEHRKEIKEGVDLARKLHKGYKKLKSHKRV